MMASFARVALALIPMLAACSEGQTASKAVAISDECEATVSNIEFTECWQKRADQARSEANATFARAQEAARLSDQRESVGAPEEYKMWLSEALGDSQASWIAFMEHQCLLQGRVARGGTGTRSMVASCQYRMSNRRTNELGDLITSIESS